MQPCKGYKKKCLDIKPSQLYLVKKEIKSLTYIPKQYEFNLLERFPC